MVEFTIDQAASADMALYVRLGLLPAAPFNQSPIKEMRYFSINL